MRSSSKIRLASFWYRLKTPDSEFFPPPISTCLSCQYKTLMPRAEKRMTVPMTASRMRVECVRLPGASCALDHLIAPVKAARVLLDTAGELTAGFFAVSTEVCAPMAASRDGTASPEEIAPVGYNAGARRRQFELAQARQKRFSDFSARLNVLGN